MEKIIRIWHNGIGDSLQFSMLPRRFSQLGHDVYISDKSPFRNSEIYDLIWGMNPYVKGISKKEANCGEIPKNVYNNTENNFIKNWERINGLEPESETPEIYYKPKYKDEYKDTVLASIGSIALHDEYNMDDVMDYVGKFKNLYIGWFMDLYDFCDAIYSCKKYICLSSGGNSLASALKKYKEIDVECLVPEKSEMIKNMASRKHFFYDNIKYVWI